MGVRTIKVADLGEGVAEVELVAWHVQVGDAVAVDQILAEVMTDKASVEIPSPVAGTVERLGGEVGSTLAVGAELILLTVADDEVAAQVQARAEPLEEQAGPMTAHAGPSKMQPELPESQVAPSQAPSPSQAQETAAPGSDVTVLPQAARPPAGDRPIASPAVRRRAWELGLDLGRVQATGPGGRIMQADLEAAARVSGSTGQGTMASLPGVDLRYAARTDETTVAVVGLRRQIARHLQDTVRRIPHFTYVEEIDVTELEMLRANLNQAHASDRGPLTLLPFLVRALVLAVQRFPQVNARFDDRAGVLTRHGAVHVGIATHTPAGLLVPVLRHAESLDPWACAAGITRLADAARAGKATRDELTGSTITITSLGALGGVASTPILNSPEVAIIAVNRILERPELRAGAVIARRMMNLSSSFDHRVVDGMDAAGFVQEMRVRLESPARLFV